MIVLWAILFLMQPSIWNHLENLEIFNYTLSSRSLSFIFATSIALLDILFVSIDYTFKGLFFVSRISYSQIFDILTIKLYFSFIPLLSITNIVDMFYANCYIIIVNFYHLLRLTNPKQQVHQTMGVHTFQFLLIFGKAAPFWNLNLSFILSN